MCWACPTLWKFSRNRSEAVVMFSPEGLYEDAVVMAGWSKGTVSVSDKWNTVFSNYDIEDMEFQQESQGNYVLKVSLSSYSQGSFGKRWRRQTAKEWYLDVRGYG